MEIKGINKLRKELMGKYYKPISDRDFDKIEGQSHVIVFRYLNDDNKPIGLALVSYTKSLTKKAFVIEDLIIGKDYRRKGNGSNFLQGIVNYLKNRGANCIEVCTKKSNKKANNLYKKLGFKDRKQIAYRIWLK